LAVTCEGCRDILGLWAGDGGEGAKYWLHVLTELKNRGVADVLMVVCDGLTGLPDAITTVWPPLARGCRCIDGSASTDALAAAFASQADVNQVTVDRSLARLTQSRVEQHPALLDLTVGSMK